MSSESISASILAAAFAKGADDVSPEPSDQPAAPVDAREVRLEALLRSEFRAVWRAVRRFGVPESSADDAAQEVFIILARKLEEIDVGEERRFLFGVAVRVAANVRRTQAVRREHLDSDVLGNTASQLPASDALLDQKRMRELLDVALDSLPDDLRTAFVLFELEGFRAPEIAELLDIPVGTVASRLRRARDVFRKTAERLKTTHNRRGGLP
jgi:RNA polymerase sigma-70 factor (ECF subfamily)